MLDFSHSLVIGPFLFHLVPSVALRQGSVAIALRKGVEHPYIKKCALPISPPEILSHNVQPCTVFSICCPVCKLLFGPKCTRPSLLPTKILPRVIITNGACARGGACYTPNPRTIIFAHAHTSTYEYRVNERLYTGFLLTSHIFGNGKRNRMVVGQCLGR